MMKTWTCYNSIMMFAALEIGLLLPSNAWGGPSQDPFQDQVAKIFSSRCLSCHNDEDRQGDFSLQSKSSLLDSGYVLAGDEANSHLLEVITPRAGKAQMPKNAEPLSTAQIAVIRQWIRDGARWTGNERLSPLVVQDFQWWSYLPVAARNVPSLDSSWIRNPVDAFVLNRLNLQGLAPAPEAERTTLIRRLYFDLIGLPPTPEQVKAFVSDSDPLAYENLVERLLSSRHYGERWARHWLDVVKYADTCGYDKDKLRANAWPYRDYVIRSFNEDKPYGRFVREQIAGDVLYPGTRDGVLGLGFLAAGPWDFIGHVEVPESKIDGKVARNLDRDDMVSNALNTFCSLTIQCARCHHHKFDPITQENYYSLQALFAAVDRAERPYDVEQQVAARRQELQQRVAQIRARLDAWQAELRQAGGNELESLERQIADMKASQELKRPPAYGYHSQIAPDSEVSKWVEVDLGQTQFIKAVELLPCHDDYAGIGAGFGFPIRFLIQVFDGEGREVFVEDRTKQDHSQVGLAPVTVAGVDVRGRRVRVTATKLAARSNDFIFALAELIVRDQEAKNIALGQSVKAFDSIEAPVRWSSKNLTDGKWPRMGRPEDAGRLAKAAAERDALLTRLETPERMELRKTLKAEQQRLQRAVDQLPPQKWVYAAATHFKPQGNFRPTLGQPRPIHVLHRGDVQKPKQVAPPGVLPLSNDQSWLLDPSLSEGERRAQLAHWLTDLQHPLVWRSIVNRVWQYHFGRGIVATPNDFGRMGALPTHPDLLDWLVLEFQANGQSLKWLHRLLVTSSTYRQSSRHEAAHARIDGNNQYLWRMNRRRMSAEEIRDSILSVSGTLDTTMGGPGFYLFELEKTEHSPHYEYHKFDPTDPTTHRRSIYRFIVRSQPDPWMTTLDCADSSQSTARRSETLTALQALSLMNNRFNLVMAENFAARLRHERQDVSGQVSRAWELVTQRELRPTERADLIEYAELHGLENLCRLLFNLSEFLYLD